MMMYFLKSGTTIKGFRGWITDVNSTAASKKISINGIYDDTTSIDGMPVMERADHNIIYDISGRKVGTTEEMKQLPKGIYMVNGKKWIVK